VEVLTPLGDTDPLATDGRQDPASTGKLGRVQSERVRGMLGRGPELRDGPVRVLSQHDIVNSGYPAASDDDHDGSTCNDHHCRAHWTRVPASRYLVHGVLRG
jgi:hypothetical protein